MSQSIEDDPGSVSKYFSHRPILPVVSGEVKDKNLPDLDNVQGDVVLGFPRVRMPQNSIIPPIRHMRTNDMDSSRR